jgi:type IV pilus assembly protein PilQ
MTSAHRVWGKGWIARVACAALLLGSIACATAGRPKTGPDAAVLSDVRVEERGEMTVVTLQGVGNPLYATREEGDRLVVDVSGVTPGGVPDEIALSAGAVEGVEVSAMVDASGAPFTRVQIALAHAVEYDVAGEGTDLAVRFVPVGQGAVAFQDTPARRAGEEMDDAAAETEAVFTAGAATTPPAPAKAEVPKAEAAPARILEAVELSPESGGWRVHLRADGSLAGANAFEMNEPARLVIDLPGIESRVDAPSAKGQGAVTRVRVGAHPDKVRVVLDGATADAFHGHRVTEVADGLVIDLGGAVKAAAPAAATAAPAKKPVADASAASTRVKQVSYQTGPPRIVIEAEGVASYQLFEPADDTVVVSLPESVLMAGAEARIAPEPGGPVSLVMAFQQPEVKRPEVRVVITRAAGLRPTIGRDGGSLVVTFDSSAQAAPVPALAAGQGGSTAAAKARAGAQPPGANDPSADGLDVLKEGGLLDGKQYTGRRISLDFKDVEIDDVLRLVAEVSDLNIIAGDDVAGKVTIRLVDVPWDQALDVILLTKGLGFVKVGNVLRIAPQTLLQQESEARLQERRAKEKLEDLVVKFQPVNYADVKNVAKMVQRLLSARGTVNTDDRTNTVIIKDIPTVIDESVALIKAIDTPTPQVLIEAKIVEANLDFSRELGTVWGSGVQRYEDAWDDGSADAQTRGLPDVRLHPDPRLLSGAGELNNFVIDNPIGSLPTALVNLGAFLLDEQFNVEVQLQAAESTGEGKVISSPRVVTLDNREAEIKQGVAIPYQTFENGDAQLQFVDAVLSLQVKPHITADKSIIMQLEVTRDAPDDSVATGSSGAPAIAKNQAKTETLVRDGQTLVIGGIYTIQKGTRQSRVPYLADVPFIGIAFRSNEIRDIRKELLIFVTPRIVDQPQLGA